MGIVVVSLYIGSLVFFKVYMLKTIKIINLVLQNYGPKSSDNK